MNSDRPDSLTGLATRTAFQDQIANWVENSQQFALILIDIKKSLALSKQSVPKLIISK